MNRKKRIVIIVFAAALILLAFPFSHKIYKDGGTKVYTSLTYKIVDFNKLTGAGEFYTETKIYPFPINFMSDDFLMASANGTDIGEADGYNASLSNKLKGLIAGKIGGSSKGENDIYGTPPEMEITYDGEKNITADSDTYCWNYIDSSGKVAGICADALHPLESREFMKEFTASTDKVKLSFALEPESLEVRCWPESCLNKSDSPYESLQVTNGEFTLKEGAYVYQIIGVWNSGDITDADASYCFFGVLN